MSDMRMKTRVIQKHAVESDWAKAINFTPLQGEIIVYDVDENYAYERFKIGDGVTNVNDLPFVAMQSDWGVNDENDAGYVKNRTHYAVNRELLASFEMSVENDFSYSVDDIDSVNIICGFVDGGNNIMDVFIDGTLYQCQALFTNGNYYINLDGATTTGQGLHIYIGGSKANMIYLYPDSFGLDMSAETRMIEVYTPEIVQQLDERYIPNTIARVSDQAQSDWSVHDETSPAYVNNRTHWSKVSLVEVLPECQPEKTDAGIIIKDKISIVAGHTYIVNWNGTSYTCIACPFEGAAFIGNGAYMGMDDTGEPFMIGCYTDEMAQYTGYYVIIMPLDGSTTCTLSIIERIEEIQKIDNKYLPDEVFANPDWNVPEGEPGHILNRTHYTEEALEEIIPETTVIFGDPTKPGYDTGTATGSAIQIYPERDETYVIEWNGVTYYSAVREYTKTDGSFGRGIGNTGIFGGGSYRQYPFLIGFLTEKEAATAGYTYFVSVENESTTATFSVGKVVEAVHRLDAKYLPENTATKEYVDTAISTSRNKWTLVQDVTVAEEVGYLFFSTDSNGGELKDKNYTKAYLLIETSPQETASNGELQAFINLWYESQTSRPRASAGNTFIKSTSKQYWKAQFDIDNALCLFGLKGIADEGWSDTINSTPDSYKLFANGAGGIYTKHGFVNNIKIQAPIGIPVGTKIQIWMR